MELRAGYKQTEVGVIPEDWAIGSLESVTHQGIRNGIVDGPFGSNLKTIHYRKTGVPIVTSGYVTDGRFYADSYLYVDPEKFRAEKRSAVSPGDIVMAKIGARCGASAILPASHPVGILSGNALKISVDESRHSTFYVWQVLWDLYLDGRMDVLRTVGAQPAISMANLKKHQIPLPPQTEQRAIAIALSDVEALLAKIDQLIAKKRDLKQAAMQQLLTGQTRLPGLSGEWEVKQLGNLANVAKGRGLSKGQLAGSGANQCILYGELFTTYERVIKSVVSKTNSAEGFLGLRGDVLLPGSTTTKGIDLAVASALLADDILLGGDINVVRTKNASGYDPVFMANLLTHTQRLAIADLAQGSTIIHLYGRNLLDLTLKLPLISEQTAIAKVLSDMDAELAALETRRNKTRTLKQGMMQALLTGRIRLIAGN
jgi:type I restriction enzyme S subunit